MRPKASGAGLVCRTDQYFQCQRLTYTCRIKTGNYIPWPWNAGQGSLKITRTDRSATYDFLLMVHGPFSYSFRDRRRFQSKIAKLAMRTRGTTWPVSGGCKIITYLESQILSFLLTYNFHRVTMTVTGRLLSITAIVKRFRTEKNLSSPPEWQTPLPIRSSQPYVVLENHSGGATRPRKKFDDIFIRFDTIPACDGHATTAIAALTHSVARLLPHRPTP